MSEDIIPESSKRKLRRHLELREARDEAKAALAAAEEAYRLSEAEIFEALEGSGKVDPDLGPPWGRVVFSRRETTYGQVLDKEALQEFFEQTAQVEEMTEVKFAGGRLNEIARQCEEDGTELPAGLGKYTKRIVSIRSPKK